MGILSRKVEIPITTPHDCHVTVSHELFIQSDNIILPINRLLCVGLSERLGLGNWQKLHDSAAAAEHGGQCSLGLAV